MVKAFCSGCFRAIGKRNRTGRCRRCAGKAIPAELRAAGGRKGGKACWERASPERKADRSAQIRKLRDAMTPKQLADGGRAALKARRDRLPPLGRHETVKDLLARRSPEEVAADRADYEAWFARIAPVVDAEMERRAAQVRAELPRKLRGARATATG